MIFIISGGQAAGLLSVTKSFVYFGGWQWPVWM